MRILRLRLEHFRGVRSCAIEWAREGVTIVEGPNEIGKSSLAEAIRILFREPDSTAKKHVKAVQPA